MDPSIRALNRFGLGARMGEARTIGDARDWLRVQLNGGPPLQHPPAAASPAAVADAIRALRRAGQATTEERRAARRRLVEFAFAEANAALQSRVRSDRPFVERLVAFWSNHLCVSTAAKVLVAPLAGSYERDVIRSYVLGKFEDMVLASAKHPAMLIYLDNFQSIGPRSRAARLVSRPPAPRGLNENYARELLELHTVGVNGGYSQEDVQELARVLTGWTITGLRGAGAPIRPSRARGRVPEPLRNRGGEDAVEFVFQEALHEPGARTVLGKRYAEGGVEQGERVIRDLCRQPSTAQFIAAKLVTHFVGDNPPPSAVARIARVFRASEGDLAVVSRALIDVPDAWNADARKFRTPQDWVIAVLRAYDVQTVGDTLPELLRQLRQPLWAPPAPNGYSDSMQDWADPDALLNRAELARTFAQRLPARKDPLALLDVVDVPGADSLRELLSDNAIGTADRLALGIASPAFQWR